MCAAWADEFGAGYAAAGAADRIDAGLVSAGITSFRSLPTTASVQVLLCTDLHAENILAAPWAPWPAIERQWLVARSVQKSIGSPADAADSQTESAVLTPPGPIPRGSPAAWAVDGHQGGTSEQGSARSGEFG